MMVNNIIYFEKKPILDTNTQHTHAVTASSPLSLSFSTSFCLENQIHTVEGKHSTS